MKLAFASGALVLGIAVAVLGCSINHRSDQYACTVTSDCEPGRVCDNGYCVVSGGGGGLDAPRADAPKPDIDAAVSCPMPCTSCDMEAKTCTIDCEKTSCSSEIACPPGYKCNVLCNTDDSCRAGVSCEKSTSCTVECSGSRTCRDVVCGPGPCAVTCSGARSCRDVACGDSCACDVTCTGFQSCTQGIQCTSLACRPGARPGCTSAPPFCQSCGN